MRTRWNSQSLSEFNYQPQSIERDGLEGKWPVKRSCASRKWERVSGRSTTSVMSRCPSTWISINLINKTNSTNVFISNNLCTQNKFIQLANWKLHTVISFMKSIDNRYTTLPPCWSVWAGIGTVRSVEQTWKSYPQRQWVKEKRFGQRQSSSANALLSCWGFPLR
jgi:hypothetical protein